MAKKTEEWRVPYVETGMLVWWYEDGDRCLRPHVAVVTAVDGDRMSLSAIGKGYSNMAARDGVKHLDDPTRTEGDNEEGAWEHVPYMRQLIDFLGLEKRELATA